MIFSGLMIPFLGTTLGAGMVFFMKGSMNQKLEKMLLGFAAGGKSGKTHISLIVQIENIIDLLFGNNQSMTFGNGTDV